MMLLFFRNFIYNLIILFFLLEIFSFLFSFFNLLPINDKPLFYTNFSFKENRGTGVEWLSEKESWGIWHKSNFKDSLIRSCFSVDYESNEFGARDDSFEDIKHLNDNKIILGDSFVEGYSVNKKFTLDKFFEKYTGKNFLNFGSSGNMGPLQYFLLYKDLIHKNINHDEIFLFLLPANDFTDNDISFWKSHKQRYRPYFKVINDKDFDYFYPMESIKKENFKDINRSYKFSKFLYKYLWTSNIIKSFIVLSGSNYVVNTDYSGYFDSSLTQQKSVIFFIKSLYKLSEKKINIISIPTFIDFKRNIDNSKENQFWIMELRSLANNNKNINFIDLLDLSNKSNFDKDSNEFLFKSCAEHWSSFGNEWAVKKILGELN
jgi:hypothetical protein